jgi:hypothetical protein
MPKHLLDTLQSQDTFQLAVNDATKFNKSFLSLTLDNMFLGWATGLKWNGFSVLKNVKDNLGFTLGNQALQTLSDTEIRVVDNYILVRGQLCAYHQVILDCNFNQPQEVLKARLLKLSDFVEFLRNTDRIELFWYDRNETIGDYQNYIDQLDASDKGKVSSDPRGLETTERLRLELEDTMSEIITKYKTRIRECFLIIPVNCSGKSIQDITLAKEKLENKQSKILKALTDSSVKYAPVEGEHLHWFLTNFISCNVRF